MTDFWLGVLAIPAAVAALAVCYIAVVGVSWAYWTWGEGGFTIKSWTDRRARLAAVVATSNRAWAIHFFGIRIILTRDPRGRARGLRWDMFLAIKNAAEDAIRKAENSDD